MFNSEIMKSPDTQTHTHTWTQPFIVKDSCSCHIVGVEVSKKRLLRVINLLYNLIRNDNKL